jgi:hypothetical protein
MSGGWLVTRLFLKAGMAFDNYPIVDNSHKWEYNNIVNHRYLEVLSWAKSTS